MKRIFGVVAVAVLVLASSAAWASNKVDVTGDLAKDGNLMIDVNWTIDTAKYKGASQEEVRKQVFEQIWKQTRPQLVKKTKGMVTSYDRGDFTKLSENKQLVKERPDGTKIYDYSARVKFQCPTASGGAMVSSKDADTKVEKEYHYRFVREGIDD